MADPVDNKKGWLDKGLSDLVASFGTVGLILAFLFAYIPQVLAGGKLAAAKGKASSVAMNCAWHHGLVEKAGKLALAAFWAILGISGLTFYVLYRAGASTTVLWHQHRDTWFVCLASALVCLLAWLRVRNVHAVGDIAAAKAAAPTGVLFEKAFGPSNRSPIWPAVAAFVGLMVTGITLLMLVVDLYDAHAIEYPVTFFCSFGFGFGTQAIAMAMLRGARKAMVTFIAGWRFLIFQTGTVTKAALAAILPGVDLGDIEARSAEYVPETSLSGNAVDESGELVSRGWKLWNGLILLLPTGKMFIISSLVVGLLGGVFSSLRTDKEKVRQERERTYKYIYYAALPVWITAVAWRVYGHLLVAWWENTPARVVSSVPKTKTMWTPASSFVDAWHWLTVAHQGLPLLAWKVTHIGYCGGLALLLAGGLFIGIVLWVQGKIRKTAETAGASRWTIGVIVIVLGAFMTMVGAGWVYSEWITPSSPTREIATARTGAERAVNHQAARGWAWFTRLTNDRTEEIDADQHPGQAQAAPLPSRLSACPSYREVYVGVFHEPVRLCRCVFPAADRSIEEGRLYGRGYPGCVRERPGE